MTKTLHGVIHGKTIELADALPFGEGAEVEIQVRAIRSTRKPGDGFLRTEGALADDTEWDAIMEEVQQGRKFERQPQWEEQ